MSGLTIREDLTVDSVTVAERCGVEHKAALQLLRTHGAKLESRFERVTFEMAPFATKGGTQKRRIAHLTEDQATAFITLFQNTEKVVDFKFALVAAFSEAKRRLAAVGRLARVHGGRKDRLAGALHFGGTPALPPAGL